MEAADISMPLGTVYKRSIPFNFYSLSGLEYGYIEMQRAFAVPDKISTISQVAGHTRIHTELELPN
jgi:hypothetical protein